MDRMIFLLTASEGSQTLAEKLAIGAEVALMGIAIVFFVLAILWGVLELFRVFFYEIPKKKAEKEKAALAAEAGQPASPGDEGTEQCLPEQAEDEGEILAAITAAIAIMTEKQPGSFRVVSFRRSDRLKKR